MATVYGYFRSDEDARNAAIRCEQLGMMSSVVMQQDQPSYIDGTAVPHTMVRRERTVLNGGLIAMAVIGILGAIVWYVIPALWGKMVLAGPLMMALYGAAIGVFVGMYVSDRKHYDDEIIPEAIGAHTADRVLVIHTPGTERTQEVEELLEAEGAIEVIHRAA